MFSGGVAPLVFTFKSPVPLFLFIPFLLAGLSLPSCPPHPVDSTSTLPANFTLPEPCDFLEAVTYVDLQQDEAEKLLKQYNEEGRKAGPPPEKRFDNRQGGFRGRGGPTGGYQRYDNRDNRGSYQSRSSDGGGGYRGGTCWGCFYSYLYISFENTNGLTYYFRDRFHASQKLVKSNSFYISTLLWLQVTVVATTAKIVGATTETLDQMHVAHTTATNQAEEATIARPLIREDMVRYVDIAFLRSGSIILQIKCSRVF